MNQFRPDINEKEVERPESPTKSNRKNFGQLLDSLGVIEKEKVIAFIPFILYLTGIALVYISNSYYAEKNIRDIDKLANELKEHRYEYITTKSELMFRSKQSEIANKLEALGIKESVVPPKKIVIEE
jgi:hypothetical protein